MVLSQVNKNECMYIWASVFYQHSAYTFLAFKYFRVRSVYEAFPLALSQGSVQMRGRHCFGSQRDAVAKGTVFGANFIVEFDS